MSRQCLFCGKKTHVGSTISRRGKSKRDGGVGLKTTGISTREFHANLQPRTIKVDGKNKRVLVCVKCLKKGKINSPSALKKAL